MTLTSHSSLKRTSWFMFVSLALAACGTDPTPYAAPEPAQHDLPTVTAVVEPLPMHYETVGSVVSDQRIEISSRITAYLRRLDVREGDAVQRGQPLATLDSEDLESAIQQASAQHQRAGGTGRRRAHPGRHQHPVRPQAGGRIGFPTRAG